MHKKIMVGIFAVILLGFSVGSLITMPKEKYPFSENENRYLAEFPEVSFNSYKDKSFMTGFDKWTSDMFIGREKWIQLKNQTERLTGKMEVAGVFTYDDRMIEKWDDYDTDNVERNLAAVDDFAVRHSDVPMYFMLVPTAQEIYRDTLPRNAQVGDQSRFIADVHNALPNLKAVDVTNTLLENKDRYIYYRTDHHWTSLGAYLGYYQLSHEMGFNPVDISNYNVQHVASDFRGTLFSKTLDMDVTPDVMDYYLLSGGEPNVKLSILTGEGYEEYDSLYFREYLDKKDKYSSFLGQNTPVMTIQTELEGNKSRLLIFKDSYAHCLVPFLTKNYSEITICDMRYINVDYSNYINVDEYDQVLFLYNVITFSDDTNIRKLNLAKR